MEGPADSPSILAPEVADWFSSSASVIGSPAHIFDTDDVTWINIQLQQGTRIDCLPPLLIQTAFAVVNIGMGGG